MKFIVPGDPKAQGRPRFFRRGVFVGTYDPQDSAAFKQRVAYFAKMAGLPCLGTPVSIKARFYLKRPQSLMRQKDPEGSIFCAKRPDVDNFLKAILDGLNGVAWNDDSQVCRVEIEKLYHEKGGVQRTEIQIEEIKCA